ncbi:hypothetical protein VST63_23105 [Mycolicibacterium sp. 050232]|uniref:hypothetical protein n=1 Tax=Mycolicibacterium sp. 050232 TaxID=3113982 RepID=UPI002E2E55A3|nr:hypothetical protein [Mycolicibacterium sp. 050232]MED5815259.1 hypothetical protein [Mycolicibacterium sp. 050232]
MSGFVRFLDGDWSWNSSVTHFLFDFLAEQLPEGPKRSEVVELHDNNVLMLDLREPSNNMIVTTIIDKLPAHLEALDADTRSAFQPALAKLLRLATSQRRHAESSDTMTRSFLEEVQAIVEPLLDGLGFALDEVDDSPDRGGSRHIVYYRSSDCKVQIYTSSREGEVNGMIAPLDAPNDFGLRADKWQYFTRFSERPDLPLEELVRAARTEYESYGNPLEWVRDRIAANFERAHAGVLKMYGK